MNPPGAGAQPKRTALGQKKEKNKRKRCATWQEITGGGNVGVAKPAHNRRHHNHLSTVQEKCEKQKSPRGICTRHLFVFWDYKLWYCPLGKTNALLLCNRADWDRYSLKHFSAFRSRFPLLWDKYIIFVLYLADDLQFATCLLSAVCTLIKWCTKECRHGRDAFLPLFPLPIPFAYFES